jgi:hypothetical protein
MRPRVFFAEWTIKVVNNYVRIATFGIGFFNNTVSNYNMYSRLSHFSFPP